MMKETDVQTKIVKAVRDAGGAASKLSHRFLVGVPDLLIKMPATPAALWEVKLDERAFIGDNKYPVIPDVTQLQYQFLKAFRNAGMVTGVLSCVYARRSLYFCAIPFERFERGQAYPLIGYQAFDNLPEWLGTVQYD